MTDEKKRWRGSKGTSRMTEVPYLHSQAAYSIRSKEWEEARVVLRELKSVLTRRFEHIVQQLRIIDSLEEAENEAKAKKS